MEHFIVAETIDSRVVKTRLPRENAQALYRKIRAAGGIASIFEDTAMQYLTDLFIIGGLDIKYLGTATLSRNGETIEVVKIMDDSEKLLDAIQKVKFGDYSLVPF
jgi:hypothetical protein